MPAKSLSYPERPTYLSMPSKTAALSARPPQRCELCLANLVPHICIFSFNHPVRPVGVRATFRAVFELQRPIEGCKIQRPR